MKLNQSLWSLIFLLGPAIYIGIEYGFWNGFLAFILTFIFGAVVGQFSIQIVSIEHMKVWSYLKGPLVAIIIIFSFYLFHK
jgi:vacuolar-type H+-ATPase subunit I/STV1